ncbi:serine racemase [Patella vulgata]|uniref:serine racemase n=1 Tax=Patella vulgata TaxID=6465 RepID=UPI00217F362E|nr:serine racemase [Patella vulgata]
MGTQRQVYFGDVTEACQRISGFIHRTPIFTNSTIDGLTGRNIYFKAENLQKTGSFKVRGAINSVLKLKEKDRAVVGVTTHSSGNHGQALACAARSVRFPCSIVVPSYTSAVKKAAIKGYGAELTECGPLASDRRETCEKVALEKNYEIIPSSDHYDVIAGQGTIAMEFLEQVPDLDAILVSVSGGGMISGIAIAAKHIKPGIKVFAVEPEGKILEKCLTSGERLWPNPPQYLDTIAEGIKLQQVGHLTWPILLELVEKEVFTVNNEEIKVGMQFVFQRMKLVVEAASGAAVAAVLSEQFKTLDSSIKNVGVILCGGNVDIDHLPWY